MFDDAYVKYAVSHNQPGHDPLLKKCGVKCRADEKPLSQPSLSQRVEAPLPASVLIRLVERSIVLLDKPIWTQCNLSSNNDVRIGRSSLFPFRLLLLLSQNTFREETSSSLICLFSFFVIRRLSLWQTKIRISMLTSLEPCSVV